jgi:hypothetical protein
MKPLRTALKLPRYCRRKPLKNGRWAYFFEPPTWARKQECPLEAEALGQNYDAAVSRAENVLLPAFDSWRTRGLSDLAPIGVTRGSFDWLVQGFKQQQKYKDVDAHTKRTYDNGTQLFADHILKDGSRAGSKQVGDFTKAFVDAVYAKLLVVESIDADGTWCVASDDAWRSQRWARAGALGSLCGVQKKQSFLRTIRLRKWV